MYGKMRFWLAVVAALAMAGSALGVEFFDDFESYTLGNINGQGPWLDWPGALPPNVSDVQAFSGTKSLELSMSPDGYGSDVKIDQLGGEPAPTAGLWTVTYQLYVTDDFDGVQNMVITSGNPMADNRDGVAQITYGGDSAPLLFTQWAPVEMLIDLDDGIVQTSYNNVPFHEGVWTAENITNMNAWMDNGTAGKVYIDDFGLTEIPKPTLTWDNVQSGTWDSSHWTGGPPSSPDDMTTAILNDANSHTVTVSAPGAVARVLSVQGGGIAIDPGQTLSIDRAAEFSLGTSLSLGAGATFSAGSGTIPAIAPEGNATISVTRDELTGAGYDDSTPAATPRVLTKQGSGTLVLDNADGASVVAAQTTLVVEGGTLQMGGADPLGGATAVTLAGGRMSITGDTSDDTPWPMPTEGLSLHLDASAITGLADGDPVALWEDSSGNGRHADVDIVARQPVYKVDGINGVPSVYFDGVFHDGFADTEGGDVMRVLPLDGAPTLAQEVFIVATRGPEFAGDGTNPGCCSSLLARHLDGFRIGPYWSSPYTFGIESYTNPFSAGGEFLVNGTEDRLVQNDVEVWTPIPDGPMILDVVAGQQRDWGTLVIAADGYPSGYESNRNWPGHIAEIIMYEGVLGDTERAQLGYYLEHKYSLDTAYRPPVPEMVMTDVDFTVTADSVLHLETDHTAELGALILKSGNVTLTGAPGGIGFTGTTIDPAATAVGVDPRTGVNLRVIDGNGSSAVFSKTGPGEYVMDNPANTGLQEATLQVSEGTMTIVANSLGGSTKLSLAGGTMVVTPVPGDDTPMPLPTEGLSLHLDASTITGLADGDAVASWADSSGNVLSATQDDPLRQPIFKTDGVNGVPAVYFGGPTEGLEDGVADQWSDVMRVVPGAGGPITAQEIFIVTTAEEPYSGDGSNGFAYGCCVSLLSRHIDGDRIGAPWNVRTVFMGPAGPQGFARDGGEFEVNGVDDQTILIDAPMIVDALSVVPREMSVSEGNPLVLAGDGYPPNYDNGQRVWHGNIAEVIMYDQALTDVQRGQIGYYLEQKYGLDTAYDPSVPSLTMTDVDFTVIGDSTLHADSDTTADLGTLILENGTVTLTGAPDGLTFTGTTVDAVSDPITGVATVGVSNEMPLQLSQIDVISADPVTIGKGGPADLVLTEANVGSGFQNATFEARGGRLIGLQDAANPFGSGDNAAALSIAGGEMVLASAAAADISYDNAVSVAADGTLTVGAGDVGAAGPLTVTVGSAANGVGLGDNTLTLQTTDDYALDVAGELSGSGALSVGASNVTLSGGGTVDVLDVDGGTLNVTAELSANLVKVAGGTVNTGNSQVVVGRQLVLDEITLKIDEGNTFGVAGSDLLADDVDRNVTLSGGELTVEAGGGGPSGAISIWHFDEGTGDVAADSSIAGNDHSGDVVDAVWVTDDADHGTVLSFDGDDDYVEAANGADFEMGSPITIGMWIKVDEPGGRLIGKGNGDNSWSQDEKCLYINANDGKVDFVGWGNAWIRGTTNVADGQWHHIALTYNDSQAEGDQEIYVDGVNDTSVRGHAGNPDSGDVFRLGWAESPDDGGYMDFMGLMDEVVVYDRSLTPEEVVQLYESFSMGAGAMDLGYTNLAVTADSTLVLDTDEDAVLGNLTLDDNLTLVIDGAPVGFRDMNVGDGAAIEGTVILRGDLSIGTGPGTLNVYEFEVDDGRYVAEVSDGASDALVIETDGFLGGSLALSGVSQVGAAVGNHHLTVLRTLDEEGAIIGEFAQTPAVGDHVGAGLFAADPDGDGNVVSYSAAGNAVEVDVFQAAAGDTNGDGEVNNTDLQEILGAGSFGNAGDWDWVHGDFNGNGTVGNDDLQLILATGFFGAGPYAASAPDTAAMTVVPEPGTLALLAGGILALLLWRRRRRHA